MKPVLIFEDEQLSSTKMTHVFVVCIYEYEKRHRDWNRFSSSEMKHVFAADITF